MELYNLYISSGNWRNLPMRNYGSAHLWIHNEEVKKNHTTSGNIDIQGLKSLYGEGFYENIPLRPISMVDLYGEIYRLNLGDQVSPELRFSKLAEEAGELTQALNMKLGRKPSYGKNVDALILEEVADTIQCTISYLDSLGVTSEQFTFATLIDGAKKKYYQTDEFGDNIETKILHMEAIKGEMATLFLNEDDYLVPSTMSLSTSLMQLAFSIAGDHGFKVARVTNEIAIKNKKWEKISKERQNKTT